MLRFSGRGRVLGWRRRWGLGAAVGGADDERHVGDCGGLGRGDVWFWWGWCGESGSAADGVDGC